MILTGPAIKSAVGSGRLCISPFDARDVNPNSYNYHLADSLLVLSRSGKPIRTIVLSPGGYILQPRTVYLGATFERIGGDHYVTVLLGRSSVARLGIFLNITADLGHLGSCSHWTLELTVVQPVRVYPRMRIGQVSFWLTDEESRYRYNGRYHLDTQPTGNRDLALTR
jgi:dCTP deaminase